MTPWGRSRTRLALGARLRAVFVVHATRKLLDRLAAPAGERTGTSTTTLGDWYATVLFWRPQMGLFVNETTLLPVLVPFAPAAGVLDRFPAALGQMLEALGVDRSFVDGELAEMADPHVSKTKDRSVVGVMNEFSRLAEAYRGTSADLLGLSLQLAHTPCGPLYRRHVFPDRELAALVAGDHPPH